MTISIRGGTVIGLALLALFVGIGCNSHANAPVDASKAVDTLRTALDSWKKGDKVDALQKSVPPIYVIDPEWQSGAVLVDYKLVNDGERKDAQLFCPVKLTVKGADGKQEEKEVTFMIATAPNLTVSRKIF